jgi:hypothetical protein
MEGGGTKREHLERIEKQTGEQQIPDFTIPIEGEHIWDWFWDLSGRRPQGFGLSLIPYSEYKAWLDVRKPLIYDWEIEILTKMDQAFLQTHQELGKKKQNKQGSR